MDNFVIYKAHTALSNKDALEITLEVWKEGILMKKKNVVSRFKSSGIWPTVFPEMHSRWRLFNDYGIKSNLKEVQPWITCREVVR